MKLKSIIPLFIIAFIWIACKSDTTKSKDIAVLKGSVYFIDENSTPAPLQNALVRSTNVVEQTYTDETGIYALEFEFDEDEKEINLDASKAGFDRQTFTALAKKGETVIVPDVTLNTLINDTTGGIVDTATHSGPAAHILVVKNHDTHLYVTESGLQETAKIEFKVTDNQGRLLDSKHKALINFNIQNGPGGGEHVSPDTMTTREGKCYTVINSGTIAGPVQLEASCDVNGTIIKSVPIQLVIYGGLPDDEHFSVAVEQLNIAGYVHSGLIDNVTAFVGDKYSNPVAPGTAVYFSTDYGIIDGAAVTDALGRASVSYITAAPFPPVPTVDPFATVTAWTFGDTLNYDSIYDSTKILLSAATDNFEVDTTYFTYTAANIPIHFNYSINDIYGNPLVALTQINVTASEGDIYGDVSLEFGDYQSDGPGTTEFNFAWAPGDSLEEAIVFISMKVFSPEDGNGSKSFHFYGERNW